jgi:hypothetical protein
MLTHPHSATVPLLATKKPTMRQCVRRDSANARLPQRLVASRTRPMIQVDRTTGQARARVRTARWEVAPLRHCSSAWSGPSVCTR